MSVELGKHFLKSVTLRFPCDVTSIQFDPTSIPLQLPLDSMSLRFDFTSALLWFASISFSNSIQFFRLTHIGCIKMLQRLLVVLFMCAQFLVNDLNKFDRKPAKHPFFYADEGFELLRSQHKQASHLLWIKNANARENREGTRLAFGNHQLGVCGQSLAHRFTSKLGCKIHI